MCCQMHLISSLNCQVKYINLIHRVGAVLMLNYSKDAACLLVFVGIRLCVG